MLTTPQRGVSFNSKHKTDKYKWLISRLEGLNATLVLLISSCKQHSVLWFKLSIGGNKQHEERHFPRQTDKNLNKITLLVTPKHFINYILSCTKTWHLSYMTFKLVPLFKYIFTTWFTGNPAQSVTCDCKSRADCWQPRLESPQR